MCISHNIKVNWVCRVAQVVECLLGKTWGPQFKSQYSEKKSDKPYVYFITPQKTQSSVQAVPSSPYYCKPFPNTPKACSDWSRWSSRMSHLKFPCHITLFFNLVFTSWSSTLKIYSHTHSLYFSQPTLARSWWATLSPKAGPVFPSALTSDLSQWTKGNERRWRRHLKSTEVFLQGIYAVES
jgi:hypothetical protein